MSRHSRVPDPYFARWLDEINGIYSSQRQRPLTASTARTIGATGLVAQLARPVAIVTTPFAGRATFKRAADRQAEAINRTLGLPVPVRNGLIIAKDIPHHVSQRALTAAIRQHSVPIAPGWSP